MLNQARLILSFLRLFVSEYSPDLIANGFVASLPLRTPLVAQSSVTYYHPDDKALAEEVINRATASSGSVAAL